MNYTVVGCRMQLMGKETRGSTLIILSAFFYATYGVWSRFMVGAFGEFNQAWTRALVLLLFLVPFQIITKSFKKMRKQDLVWFAAVAFCGGLNQAPYFYGFEHLPIGTATLLFYIMLVLGAFILGKFFFNEKLTVIKYASLGVAALGLFIIYRFTLAPDQIVPAIFTMVAGLMGAVTVVIPKKLSGRYSEIQILTCSFTVMFFSNLMISLFVGERLPVFNSFLPILGQAGYTVAILVANVFVIAGFKHLEPSVGGLLGLLEVVFAAVFGVVIFRDGLTLQLLLGSILILIGAGLPDLKALLEAGREKLLSRHVTICG